MLKKKKKQKKKTHVCKYTQLRENVRRKAKNTESQN